MKPIYNPLKAVYQEIKDEFPLHSREDGLFDLGLDSNYQFEISLTVQEARAFIDFYRIFKKGKK